MPMLRRPHDHHRVLQARLLAAHASDNYDQDRHVMTMSTSSRSSNACLVRRFLTSHGGARSNTQLGRSRDAASAIWNQHHRSGILMLSIALIWTGLTRHVLLQGGNGFEIGSLCRRLRTRLLCRYLNSKDAQGDYSYEKSGHVKC